ncbi:nucleotide exchange factor GrpE [Intrasporangium sp.]|uniref:nucleotide exchange factor GrpE n=1 Tax=Intrasporangium sp. TaxID=1925024 RepID=UPI0032216816
MSQMDPETSAAGEVPRVVGDPEGAGPAATGGAGADPAAGTGPDATEGAGTPGAPDAAAGGRGPLYADGGAGASAEPGGEDEYDHAPSSADLAEEDNMAASLLADLQRLQAEYVNYKKRVDRDRELIRTNAVSSVVEALLPVLDDIYFARQAGDLADGPFAAIADKLEETLGRFGIERVGEVGEEFDPNVHEALMHVEAEVPEGATDTTVVQVFQPGYRNGERLVRAARVSVADPA